jgi:hypothetical protein
MIRRITEQEAQDSFSKVKIFIKDNKKFKDLDDITLFVISEIAIKELRERNSVLATPGQRPNKNLPNIE